MKIELRNFDSLDEIKKELYDIGVDKAAVDIMDKKADMLVFRVYNCKFYHANLLKQEALSLGIDCAVEKNTITAETQTSDCLIFGDIRRLLFLSEKLERQAFEFLRKLGIKLKIYINNLTSNKLIFKYGKHTVDLKTKFLIMGILNVTPDSFSDGGLYNNIDLALQRTEKMIEEHADIIDIGGESTKPGSEPVSLDEELKRVIPIVEAIKKHFDITLSVDTYKSKVGKDALSAGCDIINDISGLNFDEKMVDILKKSSCGIIAMHIKGTPKDMQKNPKYEHLICEINDYFSDILHKAKINNIDEQRIVFDPGIGFGKTFDNNYSILKNIKSFGIWARPILIGTSLKSFIGHTLNTKNPKDRLFGTISSNVVSFINGARIFRVRNVKEHYEALKTAESIIKEKA